MIGICKILFDLCFYYTLSGFFFYLLSGSNPSVWGVPVLMFSMIAYMATIHRKSDDDSPEGKKVIRPGIIIFCLLPGLILAFRPTIWQICQYLPAWAFFGYTIWNGLVNTDRGAFEGHFSFTGKLYFLTLFGIFAISSGRIGNAVLGAIPYLIIYLLTGVCLMRVLREEGKLTKGRNIAVLLLLLAASITLASLQTPQLILGAVGFIYRNVISWIIIGAAYALGVIIFSIGKIISWIFSFLHFGNHDVTIDMSGSAQEIFGEEAETWEAQFPAWLEIAATVLVVLLVAFIIFMILRKLLGKKTVERKREFYTEEYEHLKKRDRGIIGGLLRPKDPRQAIRWYYRKYLREGDVRRCLRHSPADTSMDIRRKYGPFFPDYESEELRDLYIMARYRYSEEIPKSAADTANELWSRLRQGQAADSGN